MTTDHEVIDFIDNFEGDIDVCADILKFSVSYVRILLKTPDFPKSRKVGKKNMFDIKEIEMWRFKQLYNKYGKDKSNDMG